MARNSHAPLTLKCEHLKLLEWFCVCDVWRDDQQRFC